MDQSIMKPSQIKAYFINCFLLTLPILVWNMALANQLPEPFQPATFGFNIPWIVSIGENIFRTIIFLLAALMPLSIKSKTQQWGIALYSVGTLLYFSSWLVLMYYPNSAWSHSHAGFFAPAYTPFLWLMGIGLIGERYYFELHFRRWVFIALSIIFLVFHNLHTLIIFNRIHH